MELKKDFFFKAPWYSRWLKTVSFGDEKVTKPVYGSKDHYDDASYNYAKECKYSCRQLEGEFHPEIKLFLIKAEK